MITIDRLRLSDCFTPKELTDEIFRQNPHLNPPIPVKDIARNCNILLIQGLSLIDKPEGILVSDIYKDVGIIFFKIHKNIPGRERFSIAHELGHFLIQHHKACSLNNIDQTSEKEADEFASNLLIPFHLINPKFYDKKISIKKIKKLAEEFQVSFSSMANSSIRFLDSIGCVLIYLENAKVNYILTNRAFRKKFKLKIKKKDIVEGLGEYKPNTIKKEILTEIKDIIETVETDISLLKKEIYFQQNGYAVMLLTETDYKLSNGFN